MAASGSINFDIFARDRASNVFDKVGRESDGLAKKLENFSARTSAALKNAGATMMKAGATMTAGVTAPLLLLGKTAFDAASDVNESMSKVQTIFGDASGDIVGWSKTTAKSFGISQRAALDASGTFGNMFVQLGVGTRTSAKMSKAMTELSADFASFHNADTADVIDSISAAFRGEFDAVQKFVPTINAAAVEQKALEMGLKATSKELTAQDKALASYELLMQGAGAAMGDFGRTAEGAANKQRILKAQFDDAAASIGQLLLPAATQLLEKVQQWITQFNELPAPMKKAIVITAGLAAAAGPLVTIVGALVTVVGALLSPVGAVIGVLALFTAGAILAYTKVDGFREAVNKVAVAVKTAVQPVIEGLVRVFQEKVLPALRTAAAAIIEQVQPALEKMAQKFRENEPEIRKVGEWLVNVATIIAEKVIPIVASFVGDSLVRFINGFSRAIDIMGTFVRFMDQTLIPGFAKVMEFILHFFELVLDGAVTAFGWVPHLGEKLKAAADDVAHFRDRVNGYLSSIQRDIKIQLRYETIGVAAGPNILRRAAGGPVNAGQMYWVGEQGPELFAPFKSGTIIPNHDIAVGAASLPTIGHDGASVGDGVSEFERGREFAAGFSSYVVARARTG